MVQSDPPLILLVDDYPDALDMYAFYLQNHGYRVATARSGADGVTAAMTERPDVILMDLQMPGMTGAEALALLRVTTSLAAVPIVAFTAHTMGSLVDKSHIAGFDAVITKPCLPDALVAAVAQLLATPRAAQHH